MIEEEEESYRDHISTVDKQGKRVWVYPKKPWGKYFNKRKIVSYLLLILLFTGPYIKIGGEALLQLNILERKFIIFGNVFWPQDFLVFAIAMITGVVFITLFTVVYGRLFCGWVCPQTIFMEMVFRRIEYWIEGDWTQQKKLVRAPWTADKIIKKTGKHILFWLISFLIANTFLAYIIGYEKLFQIINDPMGKHIVGLISIIVFTSIFYSVFAFLREQVCTTICPYGRLQGVMLDNKSMVVAYDFVRGENRAKFKKTENRQEKGKGDCIDCNLCVHVCPTGIDIRNGTQLECVNCTACMDACDFMMEKVGLPKKLIRYASVEGIKNKTPFSFTPRVKAYTAVLLGLLFILSFTVINRKDVEVTVMRTKGTLYQEMGEKTYSNIYDLNLVNKSNNALSLELKLLEGAGEIRLIGDSLVIQAQNELRTKFMIIAKENELRGLKTNFTVGIYSEGKIIRKSNATFIGPIF